MKKKLFPYNGYASVFSFIYAAFIILCFYLQACNPRSSKSTDDIKIPHMTGTDYLVAFNSIENNFHSMVEVFHIMDSSLGIMSMHRDGIGKNLYPLPAGSKNIHEVVSSLKALPGISDVVTVALDRPYNEKTLKDAWKFLNDFGMDATSLPDAEMRKYFTSLFAGENKYVLDNGRRSGKNGVSIRLVEDLLREVAMQDNSRDIRTIDSVQIVGDYTIENITLSSPEDAPPPPDIPRLPGSKTVHEMSDAEIRGFIIKNDDRKLEDKNITIKRSPRDIEINIQFNGVTETIRHEKKG